MDRRREFSVRKTSGILRLCWVPCCLLFAGCQKSPAEVQKHLQEQLIAAKPGTVIELPAGKFHFDRTLSLTVDKVTLRGKGMDKTILSFAGQKEGAQGLLVHEEGVALLREWIAGLGPESCGVSNQR
jgi:hypothetical protein